jgi:hypothetical protein
MVKQNQATVIITIIMPNKTGLSNIREAARTSTRHGIKENGNTARPTRNQDGVPGFLLSRLIFRQVAARNTVKARET